MSTTSANNETVYLEDGEQVYPCRCGQTHRGPYGVYDWAHHNCYHLAPLVPLDADDGDYMCPACGATFRLWYQGIACPECGEEWTSADCDDEQPTMTCECPNGHKWQAPHKPFKRSDTA